MLSDLPNINVVPKNRLYYGKFKYKAKIIVLGANLCRRVKDTDEYIKYANRVQFISLIKKPALLYDETIETIAKLLSLRDSAIKHQLRIEGKSVFLYFNDVEFLNSVRKVSEIKSIDAIDLYNSDVLYVSNPKHKYRTYIKETNHKTDKEMLKEFIEYANKVDGISCSKTIHRATSKSTNRYYRYYFRSGHIDYNDENMIAIIGIYLGPMIKNTVQLQEKPK